jgi:uncharacterized membrane protein SpoIIM required for sporulation
MVYLTGLALTIGWTANLVLLIQIVALTTLQALVMVAGAVVISAQTTSVRAANLLASFIIIPFALLIQGESLIMFWGRYNILWWVLLGLALVVVVLIRMGVKLFNREELLGRDLDEINVKAAWGTFARAYVGQGRGKGFVGWYRAEVLPTLRRMWLPTVAVCIALTAAFVIGYAYAPQYRLPFSAQQLRETTVEFSARVAQFGLVSPTGSAWILFVNMRALLIATALGMFSTGVLGVILLMVPIGLVGYFAGQMSLIGVSPLWFLVAFVLPHGVFEIPAAVLEGAAIVRLGASVLAPPPDKTLGEGWLLALADWAKISLALVVPLLILAALAEAFLTPLVVQAIFGR